MSVTSYAVSLQHAREATPGAQGAAVVVGALHERRQGHLTDRPIGPQTGAPRPS